MSRPTDSMKVIILLHGFAAHWSLMTRLTRSFKSAGYDTLNWGYNSWFKPIDFHAERLQRRIDQLDSNEAVQSIDFVTHSMGCIVTRSALVNRLPKKCGRWVMLAPPNRGSYVANSAPSFLKSWMKPIGELQAIEESYVNQLPIPQNIDIAVIQAAFDYIVAGPLTRIDEEKDRIVVPGLHSQMLFRKDVAQQSMHFLQHGQFQCPQPNVTLTSPTEIS